MGVFSVTLPVISPEVGIFHGQHARASRDAATCRVVSQKGCIRSSRLQGDIIRSMKLVGNKRTHSNVRFLTKSPFFGQTEGLRRSSSQSRDHLGGGRLTATRAAIEAGGDPKVQQMLVEMIRYELLKVNMTAIIERGSQDLRNISAQSLVELDMIATRAMKELDDAEQRVLRQLDTKIFLLKEDMKLAEFDLEATEREFESYLVRLHRKSGDPFFDLLYTPSKPSTSHRKPRLVDGDAGTRSKEGSGVETFKSLLCVGISFVMTSFLWSSACGLCGRTLGAGSL
eukprot:jgi/Mesen1/8321/ME000457S07518